jgi:hypothetical protein
MIGGHHRRSSPCRSQGGVCRTLTVGLSGHLCRGVAFGEGQSKHAPTTERCQPAGQGTSPVRPHRGRQAQRGGGWRKPSPGRQAKRAAPQARRRHGIEARRGETPWAARCPARKPGPARATHHDTLRTKTHPLTCSTKRPGGSFPSVREQSDLGIAACRQDWTASIRKISSEQGSLPTRRSGRKPCPATPGGAKQGAAGDGVSRPPGDSPRPQAADYSPCDRHSRVH